MCAALCDAEGEGFHTFEIKSPGVIFVRYQEPGKSRKIIDILERLGNDVMESLKVLLE